MNTKWKKAVIAAIKSEEFIYVKDAVNVCCNVRCPTCSCEPLCKNHNMSIRKDNFINVFKKYQPERML